MRFEGRVAIVTGATRGIGLAIAERLAGEGANLAVVDIDEEEIRVAGKQLSERHGRRVVALRTDVTRRQDVESGVEETLRQLGKIDLLVNNAGLIQITPWLEIDDEEWDRIFAVNLKGTVFFMQAVAPHMKERRWGRIVNLASNAARGPAPNSAHYGAAKRAVIHLTQSVAVDLGPHNITVNAVAPGVVAATRMWDDIGAGYQRHFGRGKEARIEELVSKLPLRRPQTPEDIAAAVAFLLSDEAKEITGVCLDVDGGAAL